MLPMKQQLSKMIILLGFFALASCATSNPVPTGPAFRAMTFNVENLFDTRDDQGKNDETFLPLAAKKNKRHQKLCAKIEVPKWREECLQLDWNETILTKKIQKLGKVIASANAGRGADVVFLQEVENLRVLEQLNSVGLKDLGYRPVLIEGADVRGIDVALLTRLPVLHAQLHEIPFQNIGNRKGDTRGILNVRVQGPEGKVFSLFVVHLPAPFHPVELRKDALKFLTKLAREEFAKGYVVIAAGDFNIPSKEERETGLLKPFAGEWTIAHHVGCQSCRGSTYYAKDQTWSFLDQVWFYRGDDKTKVAGNGWALIADTMTLVKPLEEQTDLRTVGPRSLEISADGKEATGVSDHWPVYVEIRALQTASKP